MRYSTAAGCRCDPSHRVDSVAFNPRAAIAPTLPHFLEVPVLGIH